MVRQQERISKRAEAFCAPGRRRFRKAQVSRPDKSRDFSDLAVAGGGDDAGQLIFNLSRK